MNQSVGPKTWSFSSWQKEKKFIDSKIALKPRAIEVPRNFQEFSTFHNKETQLNHGIVLVLQETLGSSLQSLIKLFLVRIKR